MSETSTGSRAEQSKSPAIFLRRRAGTLLAIAMTILFVIAGSRYFGELHRLRDAHWGGVSLMAVAYLASLWFQSGTIRTGLAAFGRAVGRLESFGLFTVASAINLAVPRSGIGSTAIYLSRVRKVPVVEYGSVVLFNVCLFVLTSSVAGVSAFGLDWMISGKAPPAIVAWVFPAASVASYSALCFRWQVPTNWTFPGTGLARRITGAVSRLGGSREVIRMAQTHFLLVLLRAARLKLAFMAMGIETGILAVLMASVLADLMFIIAITPGAIGFRETAIALSATWLGTTVPVAIAVAVLDRIVFSLCVLVLAQFFWAGMIRKSVRSNERISAEVTLS
jgi:uncharacterized membrane protein YbhN (UPF0104 family)